MERAWPWRESDLVMACLLQVAGVVAIGAGWYGAAQPGTLAQQSAWVHVAVAGLVVSGAGLGQWLMRGRRAVGQRRAALVSLDPVEVLEPPVVAGRGDPSARNMDRRGPSATPPVRARGMTKVHDPQCPLVQGKDVEPAAPGDGEPCAVCRP